MSWSTIYILHPFCSAVVSFALEPDTSNFGINSSASGEEHRIEGGADEIGVGKFIFLKLPGSLPDISWKIILPKSVSHFVSVA